MGYDNSDPAPLRSAPGFDKGKENYVIGSFKAFSSSPPQGLVCASLTARPPTLLYLGHCQRRSLSLFASIAAPKQGVVFPPLHRHKTRPQGGRHRPAQPLKLVWRWTLVPWGLGGAPPNRDNLEQYLITCQYLISLPPSCPSHRGALTVLVSSLEAQDFGDCN